MARAKRKLAVASAYTGPETAADAVHTEDPGIENRIGASGANTNTNHARTSTLTAAKKTANPLVTFCTDPGDRVAPSRVVILVFAPRAA